MQTTASCKPSLWLSSAVENHIQGLYKGLNGQSPFLGRCRALFLPAREVVVEALEKPLTAIESACKALINAGCSPFISGYSVKNSIFYTEKAISCILNTPLAILPLPIQYIHQVSATFFYPKTVLFAGEIPGLKTNSYAREFFTNLQDKLYLQPEKPYLSPLATRIVSPFIAGSDVFLDTIAPFVETIEKLAYAVMQALGTLFLRPECSLKGVLYFTKKALQAAADTGAATLLSPIKFIYQVCAICYDPKKVVSIQRSVDSLKVKPVVKPLPKLGNLPLDFTCFEKQFRTTPEYVEDGFTFYCNIEEGMGPLLLMTLKEFKGKTSVEQAEIVTRLELEEKVNSFWGENFLVRLRTADENVLELLTLFDLRKNILKSGANGWEFCPDAYAIKFAFLSQDEFSKITLADMQDASLDQVQFLSRRLEMNARTLTSQCGEVCDVDILQIPLVKLVNLSSRELEKIINQIPEKSLYLLQDNQFETMDLSFILEERLIEIINHVIINKEKFIQKLSVDKLFEVVGKLDVELLRFVSGEQLKGLNLSTLSPEKLRKMFFCCASGEEQTQAKRFANIPVGKLKEIVGQLDAQLLKLISGDQLQTLDLSEVPGCQWKAMFFYNPENEKERREQQVRFANISVERIKKIVKDLEIETLRLISGEQLKTLNLSDVSTYRLKQMFFYDSKNEKEKKEQEARFRNIPVGKLKEIQIKLGNKIIDDLASEEQRQSLK